MTIQNSTHKETKMSDQTKTIQQLEEEEKAIQAKLAEAQKKLREEQAAAERKIREQKAEAERKARLAENTKHFKAIQVELEKLGYGSVIEDPDPRYTGVCPVLNIDGDKRGIHMEQSYHHGGWRSTPAGMIFVVKVGYSNASRYPLRQNGTYNAKGIAAKYDEKMKQNTAANLRKQRKEAAIRAGKRIQDRLVDKYGDLPYPNASYKRIDNIEVKCSEFNAEKVTVNVHRFLTEEQAQIFIELIKKFDAENVEE